MSAVDFGEQEEKNFEDWLDENGYEHKLGEFYECPGGHVWHEDDVYKEYAAGRPNAEMRGCRIKLGVR